jgi:hypothetical protein
MSKARLFLLSVEERQEMAYCVTKLNNDVALKDTLEAIGTETVRHLLLEAHLISYQSPTFYNSLIDLYMTSRLRSINRRLNSPSMVLDLRFYCSDFTTTSLSDLLNWYEMMVDTDQLQGYLYSLYSYSTHPAELNQY